MTQMIQANTEQLSATARAIRAVNDDIQRRHSQIVNQADAMLEDTFSGDWQRLFDQVKVMVNTQMTTLDQSSAELADRLEAFAKRLKDADDVATHVTFTERAINQDFAVWRTKVPPRDELTSYFPFLIPNDLAELLGIGVGITKKEVDMLDNLSISERIAFIDIYNQAFSNESIYFGARSNNDGLGDAYRHADWSAMLARRFGEEWAREYTGAHENIPDNQPAREYMDRHNNELGIRIARENPNISDEELSQLIFEAIKNGEGIYIPGANEFPVDLDERDKLIINGPLSPTNLNLDGFDIIPEHIPGNDETRSK